MASTIPVIPNQPIQSSTTSTPLPSQLQLKRFKKFWENILENFF